MIWVKQLGKNIFSGDQTCQRFLLMSSSPFYSTVSAYIESGLWMQGWAQTSVLQFL